MNRDISYLLTISNGYETYKKKSDYLPDCYCVYTLEDFNSTYPNIRANRDIQRNYAHIACMHSANCSKK